MTLEMVSQEQDIENRRRALNAFAQGLMNNAPWTPALDAEFRDTRCHLIPCSRCGMDPYCNKLLYILEAQGYDLGALDLE